MRAFVLACLAGLCVTTATADGEAKGQGKGRVLLAWEKTRFKESLIDEMEELLVAQEFEVVKAEHSKKGLDKSAADFDAVFITNSGVHSKVRPWISEWLEKNKAQSDRILLHTTQTRNWKVEAVVDSVTSASSRADVESLAATYVKRLTKIAKESPGV